MNTKQKKMEFKNAFEELEELVGEFETKEINLDDGLKKFERGLELAKFCRDHIEAVENKVVEIKKKYSDILGED